MLSPLALLLALLALTALAVGISELARRRQSLAVAAVAARWQMRYLADDRFELAPRVAQGLPVAGAADVAVRDLIYGEDAGAGGASFVGAPATSLRYFFTVEYTLGVVRGKRRHLAVGTMREERGGGVGQGYSEVSLAPSGLSVVEQYEHLKGATSGSSLSHSTGQAASNPAREDRQHT
jgi:hypothetical protein